MVVYMEEYMNHLEIINIFHIGHEYDGKLVKVLMLPKRFILSHSARGS